MQPRLRHPSAKGCQASDPADVQVNKKTDTVTVHGDTSTLGNNYSCYTNIAVTAGDLVTFDFIGTCGGGTPRVYLQFDGGAAAGENTFDSGVCTMNADGTGGTVTYTVMTSGTITAFALIYDRDNWLSDVLEPRHRRDSDQVLGTRQHASCTDGRNHRVPPVAASEDSAVCSGHGFVLTNTSPGVSAPHRLGWAGFCAA